MAQSDRARLAVDIGGTFTDVVLETPGGRRVTTKLLTTYTHPGEAVLNGIAEVLRQSGTEPAQVGLIIHGTTLATNALIERSGAVTALLTTEGHRDALEMAHEDRFEQYDVMIDRPRPLVPRYLRLPVRERLDRDGQVLISLDESTVEAALPVHAAVFAAAVADWRVASAATSKIKKVGGKLPVLEFAEILTRFQVALGDPSSVLIHQTSTPPLDTIAVGFVTAQLGLGPVPGRMVIFGNAAPRRDRDEVSAENRGRGLRYARLDNGI